MGMIDSYSFDQGDFNFGQGKQFISTTEPSWNFAKTLNFKESKHNEVHKKFNEHFFKMLGLPLPCLASTGTNSKKKKMPQQENILIVFPEGQKQGSTSKLARKPDSKFSILLSKPTSFGQR